MIEYHKPSLSDKAWVKQRFSEGRRIDCEYSFGNLICYCEKYHLSIADVHGCFVSRCALDDRDDYSFPVGAGDCAAAVAAVLDDAAQRKRPVSFYSLTESDKTLLETAFPGRFEIRKNRNAFDYIYRREDLETLAGKKYQSKRNHISFFNRNNRWSYERISAQNKDACLAMSRQWLEQNTHEDRDELEDEYRIIKTALARFEDIDFVGGLIRCDGRVVAYCMGEALSDDVFCVHFEKAFSDIRGAYSIINQQFVAHELQAFTYVNREDDVGHENLRQAKLSYHPAFFVEKYEARLF